MYHKIVQAIWKNRYIQTAKIFILISACIHVIILSVYAVSESDIAILNYFNILDLDLFFLGIAEGPRSQFFSIAVICCLYFLIYYLNGDTDQEQEGREVYVRNT